MLAPTTAKRQRGMLLYSWVGLPVKALPHFDFGITLINGVLLRSTRLEFHSGKCLYIRRFFLRRNVFIISSRVDLRFCALFHFLGRLICEHLIGIHEKMTIQINATHTNTQHTQTKSDEHRILQCVFLVKCRLELLTKVRLT